MMQYRSIAAHVLLVVMVIATSVGCALHFDVGAGLVALGITSGIYGWLLGQNSDS